MTMDADDVTTEADAAIQNALTGTKEADVRAKKICAALKAHTVAVTMEVKQKDQKALLNGLSTSKDRLKHSHSTMDSARRTRKSNIGP